MRNQKKALVTNTYGTIIAQPAELVEYENLLLSDPKLSGKINDFHSFMRKYNQRFGGSPPETDEDWRYVGKLKNEAMLPLIPYPNSEEFIMNVKKRGLGLIIFAGASPEESGEIYFELGIGIDNAYTVAGMDRNATSTFEEVGKRMQKDGFMPVAYLTHKPAHAMASAAAWGKGLICRARNAPIPEFPFHLKDEATDEIIGKVYPFEWDGPVRESEHKKVLDFLAQ